MSLWTFPGDHEWVPGMSVNVCAVEDDMDISHRPNLSPGGEGLGGGGQAKWSTTAWWWGRSRHHESPRVTPLTYLPTFGIS